MRFMQKLPRQLRAPGPTSSWGMSGWGLLHASPGRLPETLDQGKPRVVTQVRGGAAREGCSLGQIVGPGQPGEGEGAQAPGAGAWPPIWECAPASLGRGAVCWASRLSRADQTELMP